jgi:hypothetical protein
MGMAAQPGDIVDLSQARNIPGPLHQGGGKWRLWLTSFTNW